jgi:anti-sigma regulatory factor (Ser/Thr protein kinase)
MWDELSMSTARLLWGYVTERPREALAQRPRFLAAVRTHSGTGVDEFAAKLIYTELIGNVVRHAPGAVEIRLQSDGRSMLLEVSDDGPGFELGGGLPPTFAESGRGLFLVAQFADRMWVETNRNRGAKIVAELPRPRC